jgi:predicted short-subunit dehydrogenase-like oxidoreductase (DUF2520 family)
MLPGMARRPGIAIVGAGNLGSALALSLRRAGYTIDAVIARSGRTFRDKLSLRKAQRLAKNVRARAVANPEKLRADVIWFCVPDSEIRRAAESFAGKVAWTKEEWKRKIALHSSGALTSDELAVLRRRGTAVASVHPMMTFVRESSFGQPPSGQLRLGREPLGQSAPSLKGAPFAIEGDGAAVRVARRIARDLGGDAYSIRKADKVAYHAWGTFASPLLIALLATTERVAAMAGIQGKTARRRMLPILRQTLANYATRNAADAFSGPLIRGDVETVKRHLRVLRKQSVARDVYQAIAKSAVRYLPGKSKQEMQKLLRSQASRLSKK